MQPPPPCIHPPTHPPPLPLQGPRTHLVKASKYVSGTRFMTLSTASWNRLMTSAVPSWKSSPSGEKSSWLGSRMNSVMKSGGSFCTPSSSSSSVPVCTDQPPPAYTAACCWRRSASPGPVLSHLIPPPVQLLPYLFTAFKC